MTEPPKPSKRRRFLALLGKAAFVYLSVVLMLWLLENRMVYVPTAAAAHWVDPAPYGLAAEDVSFRSTDGTLLHGWWCPVEDAAGVLLYAHGNAGNLSHRAPLVRAWQQQMNLSVFLFDYPGFGRSEGRPNEASCLASGEAAFNWLVQTKHVAPGDIWLYGESLGGGIMTDLATRHPHRVLILESTFTSLPDVAAHVYPWLPARWLMSNRYDNLAKIGQTKSPVFLVHGDADELIPVSQSKTLYEAAPGAKQLFVVPGGDHGLQLSAEFFDQLREFVKENTR